MESFDKKRKYYAFNNLQGLDILYKKINNILDKKNKDYFSLSLYSFNIEDLNLKYSNYIELFDQITTKLAELLNNDVELFHFAHNKIISFSDSNNNANSVIKKLQNEKFYLNNEKIFLSPKAAEVNWPEDGEKFDDLIELLVYKLDNNLDSYFPSNPNSIVINRKDEHIDKVEKASTQLYLVAKNDNIEIIRQNIKADKTIQIISGEPGDFEVFYILEGKIEDTENNNILSPGDLISVKSGDKEKYFKSITDVVLLYITSTPIFASEQKRIKELLSLNKKVAEKDVETNEHCIRLQKLSRLTAKEMNLVEKKIFNLGYASFLHDIGKAKIPASLLKKPGGLTDQEWEKMKKHTNWGKKIILNHFTTTHFKKIAEIIFQHHERWDGTGYPQGLAGEEILVEAQILSVVDAYDAMTYERPYQRAFSRKEAIEEIKSEKGKQFSPRAVEAFLKAEQKFHKEYK